MWEIRQGQFENTNNVGIPQSKTLPPSANEGSPTMNSPTLMSKPPTNMDCMICQEYTFEKVEHVDQRINDTEM